MIGLRRTEGRRPPTTSGWCGREPVSHLWAGRGGRPDRRGGVRGGRTGVGRGGGGEVGRGCAVGVGCVGASVSWSLVGVAGGGVLGVGAGVIGGVRCVRWIWRASWWTGRRWPSWRGCSSRRPLARRGSGERAGVGGHGQAGLTALEVAAKLAAPRRNGRELPDRWAAAIRELEAIADRDRGRRRVSPTQPLPRRSRFRCHASR